MYDFEVRHMIEALCSGVPSRSVGQKDFHSVILRN